MKNGYYLSAYISIDKIGNLYKLISDRHDMAVALWEKKDENISLLRYWELERLSRIKHHDVPFFDENCAIKAIADLLAEENLSLDDIVEIWGCPKIGVSTMVEEGDYYYHSISHLFSALLIDTDIFYSSKILSLALDFKSDNEIDKRKSKNYGEYVGCFSDHGNTVFFNISSPAILWSICKNELNMQEGSLMALATATKCHLKEKVVEDVLLDFEFPNYDLGYYIYESIFDSLSIEQVEDLDSSFSIEENLISAGMKEINRITQNIMERQLDDLLEKYSIKPQETYLSISGGFGLNCPTNSHLMKKYNFIGFLGPPCMDDSGEALGIGLYEFYKRAKRFKFKLGHAFYGKKYESDELILEKLKRQGYIIQISNLSEDIFVNDIKNDVIVWFDSCAEIGPRALGHRSILGDPRSIETKDRLNKVKKRQFWRPVAPIVLRDYVGEWFEDDIDSPYMLHTSHVKYDKQSMVPAVLHYDGSARLQTIKDEYMCSTLYRLISCFYNNTKVPMICNTSLNDKGEPIINTIDDAIRFAYENKIKVAYINRKRIEINLDNQNNHYLHPIVELDVILPETIRQQRMQEENPFNLTINDLLWRNIFGCDIKDSKEVDMLKKAVRYMYKNNPEMKRLIELELNDIRI